MKCFLDSPNSHIRPPTPKNASLIDILNTPSKGAKPKLFLSKPDSDSSHSSTTVDDICEVSFENQKLKK